jgi:hypothetical protein
VSEYRCGFRPPVPKPVAGCADCATFLVRAKEAAARGDQSAAADQRVLMRRHQERDHG